MRFLVLIISFCITRSFQIWCISRYFSILFSVFGHWLSSPKKLNSTLYKLSTFYWRKLIYYTVLYHPNFYLIKQFFFILILNNCNYQPCNQLLQAILLWSLSYSQPHFSACPRHSLCKGKIYNYRNSHICHSFLLLRVKKSNNYRYWYSLKSNNYLEKNTLNNVKNG